MRYERLVFLVSIFLLSCARAMHAQETVAIELAGPREVTRSISTGSYTIELVHIVPALQDSYTVVVRHDVKAIPKLDPHLGGQGVDVNGDDPCPDVTSAIRQIDDATTEREVANLAGELRALSCSDPTRTAQQERYLGTVVRRPVAGVYELLQGQEIVVTVARNQGTEHWRLTLETGDRGEWNAGYGFVFIPDGNDEPYLETLDGTPTQYVVRNNQASGLRFLPAVFYSWTPRGDAIKDFSVSLSAGLGADLSNPTVLFGAALTYNRNVALVAGGTIIKEKHLLERYLMRDTVSQNLTPDQLVAERYEPALFFGVSFRFDSSPFASTNTGPGSEGDGQAVKSSDTSPAVRAEHSSESDGEAVDGSPDGEDTTSAG